MATFTTNRLVIRPFKSTDDEALFVLRNNVEAMRHIPRPRAHTLEDTRKLLTQIAENEQLGTGKGWAICLKDTDRLIGFIGFVRMEKEHRKSEIGYQILPGFWRQGYVSEAMTPVLTFGFTDLELHRVEAHIDPENQASIGLASRFGFTREAHLREHLAYEGKFLDTVIFGLLKEEWLSGQPPEGRGSN